VSADFTFGQTPLDFISKLRRWFEENQSAGKNSPYIPPHNAVRVVPFPHDWMSHCNISAVFHVSYVFPIAHAI
jgi:hypothetical protein